MGRLDVINGLRKEIKEYDLKIQELIASKKRSEDTLAFYLGKSVKDKEEVKVKTKKKKKKSNSSVTPIDAARVIAANTNSSKLKLSEKIVAVLLKNNVPMTSSELRKGVNDLFFKNGGAFEKENWSPQLSTIYRDPKNNLGKVTFPDNPFETRFFYGLSEWFGDEGLTPEYMKKLAAKHKFNVPAAPLFGV